MKHFIRYAAVAVAFGFWLTPKAQNELTVSKIAIDSTIAPDAFTDSIIAIYGARIDSILSEPLIECTEPLVWGKPESTLTRTFSDLFFNAALRYAQANNLPLPQMALLNVGGLRRNMPAGQITRRDIMELLPFDNDIVLLRLSGEDLCQMLLHIGRRGGEAISNAQMTYEASTLTHATCGGAEIKPDSIYTIATIDYIADGGGGFEMLSKHKYINTGYLWRDAITDQIELLARQGKKLTPPSNLRITIKK